ncbi:MAG TPA: R3H domain-containing nucleic acid-binding protein [Patescibacteria group bacterium]|jgi:spoIIIJ-associated protein|nr:R3H domain-containing nucleic acid-binding protein [Patescibacteria group bacterium]
MAKANKKQEKIIKNFFVSLGIDAEMAITEDEEAISVNLESEDTGMIIGYHGETLEALQLVLSLVLAKEQGEFKRVSVEVGDYKKNRTEWLERLALDAKERALSQGKEVYLSELKSWERRVVHLSLQDDKEVTSESSGEGKDRVLVIKPK